MPDGPRFQDGQVGRLDFLRRATLKLERWSPRGTGPTVGWAVLRIHGPG
jgi:hypothetical protein